jgi:hypothetical protein
MKRGLQMTAVIAGTNMGCMNNEYRIEVLSTVEKQTLNLADLKKCCLSFIHTTGYTLP